jgi:hypothetical protein
MAICPALGWGQAMQFDGISQTANVPTSGLTGQMDHSVVLWMKLNQSTICVPWQAGNSASGNNAWEQFVCNFTTYGQIGIGNNEGSILSSASIIFPTNVIACVSWSNDSTKNMDTALTLYMNGSPLSTTYTASYGTLPINLSGSRYALGYRWYNNARFSKVIVYEMRIYNRILSAGEHLAISRAYPIGSDKITKGLIEHIRGPSDIATGDATSSGYRANNLSGGVSAVLSNGVISAPSIIGNRRTK